VRNCQQANGADRALGGTWYRVLVFYFTCTATVLGQYETLGHARQPDPSTFHEIFVDSTQRRIHAAVAPRSTPRRRRFHGL